MNDGWELSWELTVFFFSFSHLFCKSVYSFGILVFILSIEDEFNKGFCTKMLWTSRFIGGIFQYAVCHKMPRFHNKRIKLIDETTEDKHL